MADRRVVITGVGLVTPIGNSADAVWDALCAGRSGVAPIEAFPTGVGIPTFGAAANQFSGKIDDFGDLEKEQKKAIRKALKLMCRETMMGVAVAQSALQDAGIENGSRTPDRAGCVFGTDYMLTMPEDFIAGCKSCEDDQGEFQYAEWGGDGMTHVTPLWLLKYLPNMPASHVAIYNDLRGPNNSLTLREAAANAAVGEAWFTIARGSADVMLAGATGTRIHPTKAIHAVQHEELADDHCEPTKASRPFDRDRTGMVLGEGAGAVVLEELETAQNRGAKIYGEVVARASSSVASTRTVANRRAAIENTLKHMLTAAQVEPRQIGHIHAHGLATRQCDLEEAQAISSIFGADTACQVTAAKSYFGNLGAGCGMVELITSLLALQHGELFPILNYETPDPECPIRAATSHGPAGETFINLSVTPQGQASGLLIRAV